MRAAFALGGLGSGFANNKVTRPVFFPLCGVSTAGRVQEELQALASKAFVSSSCVALASGWLAVTQ